MFNKYLRLTTILVGSTFLTACGDLASNGIDLSRISTPFQRENATVPSIDRPAADNRGVITYEDYQVIVAAEGDSLTAMANRVGLTATELAETNGLPVRYSPRAGEVLALPKNGC